MARRLTTRSREFTKPRDLRLDIPITLKFDRNLGCSAAAMPVIFMCDTFIITSNLAVSRLHCRYNLVNRGHDGHEHFKSETWNLICVFTCNFQRYISPFHLNSKRNSNRQVFTFRCLSLKVTDVVYKRWNIFFYEIRKRNQCVCGQYKSTGIIYIYIYIYIYIIKKAYSPVYRTYKPTHLE